MSVIAIDGPGGSGKSTVARALAARLGVERLDTGAMYRAVALASIRKGIAPDDGLALAALIDGLEIKVESGEMLSAGDSEPASDASGDGVPANVGGHQPTRVLLNGEDVSAAVRSPEVDAIVSVVSTHPAVRVELVARQRAWVLERGSGVVEGRDITSVVLPDADVKVYLTADPAVRAKRRAEERAEGAASPDEVEDAGASIARRDEIDASRTDSPLLVAPGAVVIDSSRRSVEQIVEEIVGHLSTPATTSTAPAAAVATATIPTAPAPGSLSTNRSTEQLARPATRPELAFYHLCRFIAVGVSRLWYPGGVTGREHLPKSGAYLLAPVHRTNLDWLVVARVTRRRLRFMVKGEVWKVGPIGTLLEALGAFKVNRGAADREALQRSIEVLKAGEPMVVFPEGTRGAGPSVGELREGVAYLALRANVPIIPVGVSALERSMPRGAKFPRPVRVRIVVGPPIHPGAIALEGNARGRISRTATHALSAQVRAGIQGAFDLAERRPPAVLAGGDVPPKGEQ